MKNRLFIISLSFFHHFFSCDGDTFYENHNHYGMAGSNEMCSVCHYVFWPPC